MSCHILGFPLMATAQARREAALGCRTPLVDFACTACGQRTSFAAWANTLVLAAIACRRCGEIGRWGLSHLQPNYGSRTEQDAAGHGATTWVVA
jgi:hypothetical protein